MQISKQTLINLKWGYFNEIKEEKEILLVKACKRFRRLREFKFLKNVKNGLLCLKYCLNLHYKRSEQKF